MGTDHARRLSRIETAQESNAAFIHVEVLPGMSREEGLRLWCGADRREWPSERSVFIVHVNGLAMQMIFHDRVSGVPYCFMEDRSDLLFQSRWKALCEAFDQYRTEISELSDLTLLEYHRAHDYEAREVTCGA